eukprot:6189008-Pleurochrysis_carterae.AAC.1
MSFPWNMNFLEYEFPGVERWRQPQRRAAGGGSGGVSHCTGGSAVPLKSVSSPQTISQHHGAAGASRHHLLPVAIRFSVRKSRPANCMNPYCGPMAGKAHLSTKDSGSENRERIGFRQLSGALCNCCRAPVFLLKKSG